MNEEASTLAYRRARFGTRLPTDCLYTRSHYWLRQFEPGVWRIGFTRFASRMLGDIVEFQIETKPGEPVSLGQRIGWIEGFKAVSDVFSVASGAFLAVNPELANDITLLETDPHRQGWLFSVQGIPDPEAVDASGYSAILDATIDQMLESRHDTDASE